MWCDSPCCGEMLAIDICSRETRKVTAELMLCVKLFIRRGEMHGGGWGHGHVMHYAIVLLISFLEIKAITSNSSCYMYQ